MKHLFAALFSLILVAGCGKKESSISRDEIMEVETRKALRHKFDSDPRSKGTIINSLVLQKKGGTNTPVQRKLPTQMDQKSNSIWRLPIMEGKSSLKPNCHRKLFLRKYYGNLKRDILWTPPPPLVLMAPFTLGHRTKRSTPSRQTAKASQIVHGPCAVKTPNTPAARHRALQTAAVLAS